MLIFLLLSSINKLIFSAVFSPVSLNSCSVRLFFISDTLPFNLLALSLAFTDAFCASSSSFFRTFSSSSVGALSGIGAGTGWFKEPHTGQGTLSLSCCAIIPACSFKNSLFFARYSLFSTSAFWAAFL